MWGGCGQGSCIWGGRIQRQSKGKEREVVAGRSTNFTKIQILPVSVNPLGPQIGCG